MTIKIESNIPLPPPRQNVASKYPWREMKVGDSFLVPIEDGENIAVTRDRANKVVQYAQRNGAKFCTRKVEGGIRIWRIA